jgi:hypothetical protein
MCLKAHPGASLPPGFQVKPFKAFKDGNRTWIWNEPENPGKSIETLFAGIFGSMP